MDMQKLEKRMDDMRITVPMMARELGMDPSTYYRKRQKNGEEFSAIDLLVFKRVLQMSNQDAQDILLS
jgi:hypothetical protein